MVHFVYGDGMYIRAYRDKKKYLLWYGLLVRYGKAIFDGFS